MTETYDPRPERMKANNWERTRERVFRRDGRCCRFCGIGESAHEDRTGKGLHVHHIVPRSHYGSDELSNLISVCQQCHVTAEQVSAHILDTAEERQRLRKEDMEPRKHIVSAINELSSAEDKLDDTLPEDIDKARETLVEWLERGGESDE